MNDVCYLGLYPTSALLRTFIEEAFDHRIDAPQRIVMMAPPILAAEIYRPLKHSEIRVLELLPGDKAAPILCHLRHVEIEYYNDFEAVSYTWGNEQHNGSIIFEKGTLAITPNLEAALREFRHPVPGALWWGIEHVRRFFANDSWRHTLIPGTRYLWIDAICINQKDLDERNRQIKVMGEIYRRAKRLLIWLGVESRNSDVAMNFLSMAGETREMGDHIYFDWLRENTAHFQPVFESVIALLSRPWFTRAWILQEYVLGGDNNTLFYCGKKRLPRRHLSIELFDSLYERWDNFNIAQDPTSQLTAIGQHSHMAKVFRESSWRLVSLMRSELKHDLLVTNKAESIKAAKSRRDPKLSIVYWLELNRNCGATDPRDKLYSILGLVSRWGNGTPWDFKCDIQTLILDYGATVDDVYASVVKAIFDGSTQLDILGCVSPASLITRSWVPDWTSPGQPSFSIGMPGQWKDTLPRFAADKLYWLYCGGGAVFAHDLTTLTVNGILWDYIDQIIICDAVCQDADVEVPSLKYDSGRIWAQTQRTMHYGSERGCKSAIWRTLFTVPGDTWKEENSRRTFDSQTTPGRDVLERMSTVLKQKNAFQQFATWTQEAKESFEQDLHLIKEYAALDYPRDFIITKKGYIGQAPYSGRVQCGDVVGVLFGCSTPYILRPVGKHYELIGDCYLDGIMYGEAIELFKEGKAELQSFELH